MHRSSQKAMIKGGEGRDRGQSDSKRSIPPRVADSGSRGRLGTRSAIFCVLIIRRCDSDTPAQHRATVSSTSADRFDHAIARGAHPSPRDRIIFHPCKNFRSSDDARCVARSFNASRAEGIFCINPVMRCARRRGGRSCLVALYEFAQTRMDCGLLMPAMRSASRAQCSGSRIFVDAIGKKFCGGNCRCARRWKKKNAR